jgi:hypothetical protein
MTTDDGSRSSPPARPSRVSQILSDSEKVLAAVRAGQRRAIREHLQEGLPLAVWRDGSVVWVPAEELAYLLEDEPDEETRTAAG